ncbi:MAG: hypothetical protein Kow0089_14880 [Desulfobulbaceae bacterium]
MKACSFPRLLFLLSLLGSLLVAGATGTFAQGEEPSANSSERESESLPVYREKGFVALGFRWVELDSFSRAAEYEEDESSVTLDIKALSYPLPHRFHGLAEYRGENSYYGDLGYAWRDLVLVRDILVGVHHNLDHYNFLLPGTPPSLTYEDRNPRDQNFVDFTKNEFSLRLKAPDFPTHAILKHRYVKRDGSIEERFMGGRLGGLVLTSESREIDWESNDLSLGANSHLGPLEVEYIHSRSRFDPGSGSVLDDPYPASFVYGRPADTYPHNVVPETESFVNALKVHTSFTGRVVASATLSGGENSNNYSGAEAGIWKGAFDLRWIPDPVLSLAFRYRHREEDREDPDQVTLAGLSNRITYPVRRPVSTRRDQVSLSTRYRPLPRLTLIGQYGFERLERTDLDDWVLLPDESDNHHANLAAHFSPLEGLQLKAIYDFRGYEHPSYNTEPDQSNRVRFNATWTPAEWLNTLLDYSLTLTDRDDLLYLNASPYQLVSTGERDGRTDNLMASLTFVVSPEATVTTSWAWNRWKTEQDLAYSRLNTAGTGGLPLLDRGVPYTDEAHTFGLSLFWQVRKDTRVTVDLSHTISEGEFFPADVIKGGSGPQAGYSSLKVNETIGSLELARKLSEEWEAGFRFQVDLYDDRFSGEGGDHQDGELFVTILSLKRYF